MTQIVECVPNFSDGRNPKIYNGIADQIRNVRGVQVLNVSPDPDHNRTVITFVGAPTAVVEAAFRAIAFAAQHINLDTHTGEHPRIGATDVVPFIPVRNVTMADCVALAQQLGQRVGQELGIAVYLYEEAATRPERTKLSAIRKGEYELWKQEVATNPARQPDFGPAEPQSWGATVIGARPFLIAYNLYLNSSDVEAAEKIAREIRFIGGGLRFLQAKGFLVEGQAQVSMNLTNFEKTPIYRVQEMVRREAARYGLTITKAELIGMSPQKALMDSAKYYLQLDDVEDNQILEYQMAEAAAQEEADHTPHDFIAAVASKEPTPGGGSVAALAGALGTALAQMVAGLTIGRKKYADVTEQAQAILTEAAAVQEQLTTAVAEDAAAYQAVMAVFRDKELAGEARDEAIEAATIGAGEVPLRVARLSLRAAQLALAVAELGNVNAVTDGAAGVLMARTAVQVAALNVKTNAVNLKSQTLVQKWQRELAELEGEADELAAAAMRVAAQRGGF
ncbi:MAG: glutamate formimidoyltransferase [Ardenticatenaceae bacterium]|nr:glutamate formimidoyltransferase [Ardenticatenaceae bacterium]